MSSMHRQCQSCVASAGDYHSDSDAAAVVVVASAIAVVASAIAVDADDPGEDEDLATDCPG